MLGNSKLYIELAKKAEQSARKEKDKQKKQELKLLAERTHQLAKMAQRQEAKENQ